MRTEKEIMRLILDTAKGDERIRAVYMNGSRTNSNAPKDIYQDYDIVYVVTETKPFLDNNWTHIFGNPLIVQEPDWNDANTGLYDQTFDFSRHYTWLMLFDDGSRIDLTLQIAEEAVKNITQDKLTTILLDKDKLLPEIPPPTDIDYHVRKPAEADFTASCNDFWWCLNNVAKGIARDQLPFAMSMLNVIVRSQLDRMVEWYIGIHTDFTVSAGKMGKYFKRYLPEKLYHQYANTYACGNYDEIWLAVFTMCDLFHELALQVSERLGFAYRQAEEDGMRKYLSKVKNNKYGQLKREETNGIGAIECDESS